MLPLALSCATESFVMKLYEASPWYETKLYKLSLALNDPIADAVVEGPTHLILPVDNTS